MNACPCGWVILTAQSFIPAAAQTGRSGLSCTGCRWGCGRSAASGRGRCRTASSSAPTSPPGTAGAGARATGRGSGVGGATQGDPSGASAPWGGASGNREAGVWRRGGEERSAGPGRKPAAAAGWWAAGLRVSEGAGSLQLSWEEKEEFVKDHNTETSKREVTGFLWAPASLTCCLFAWRRPGEVRFYPEGRQGPWSGPPQTWTEATCQSQGHFKNMYKYKIFISFPRYLCCTELLVGASVI